MADITISKNDKGFYLSFTIHDSDGNVYVLTDYTITLKIWVAGSSGTPTIEGACTIVNATAGTCRYLITASDFTSVKHYRAELELTQSGIIESTEEFTIEVRESA